MDWQYINTGWQCKEFLEDEDQIEELYAHEEQIKAFRQEMQFRKEMQDRYGFLSQMLDSMTLRFTEDKEKLKTSLTGCLADFDDMYQDTVYAWRMLFYAERLLEIYDVFLKISGGIHRSEIMLREETICHENKFGHPECKQYVPTFKDYLPIFELRDSVGEKRFTDICDQIWESVKKFMQKVVEIMLEGHTDCEHLTTEFFKYLKKQYGQFHNMGDAVQDSKLLVKTLSYLYGKKDTYGHCFEMICEQILKEPERLRLSEMRGQIWDLLTAALLRVVEKMRGGQTDRENFITGFSECVKRLYEQHEHKSSDMGETVKESELLVKSLFELRANVGDKRFLKIYESVLRQKFIFTNSLLFNIDRGLMPLKELVIALKAIMEEMKNSLNYAVTVVCFLSNALLLLICSMLLCQGTFFNFKKNSRLKYLYEKATLLILWRCGDVEQNPGPASSDITRDFCKKMISMLVVWYWKMKPEQKPKKAKKYDTKPDGWPAGSWYGDPSKGTNEDRDNMLKTLQETCTDNGVEVPTEWLNVIEKYLSKEANPIYLYSWLCRQRFVETTNQMFDRLPEIDKEERYEILEHIFQKMKSYLPDLSSQYLQSRKLGPKSRKMEFENLSTMSPDRETICGTKEVAVVASRTINAIAIDLLAVDGVLDPNGTSVVQVTPEVDSQKTSNEGLWVGNNELSTVQYDNISSFISLLGDNTTCFAASNTTVTPLPYACENNGDTANINDDNYRKRKLDTREDDNEAEISTKRYKTSGNSDCETVVSFPNGDDSPPFGETFPCTKEHGIQSGFAAETALDTREVGDATEIATKRYITSDCRDFDNAVPVANSDYFNPFGEVLPKPKDGSISGLTAVPTFTDNMPTVRKPDFHELDTISAVQPDDLVPCPMCGNGTISSSLMNEPERQLSDDFISKHSSST